VNCGIGHRRGPDPALLWLWRRPETTAPSQPLAWEPPYAAGAAQQMAKDKKKKKKKKEGYFGGGSGHLGKKNPRVILGLGPPQERRSRCRGGQSIKKPI